MTTVTTKKPSLGEPEVSLDVVDNPSTPFCISNESTAVDYDVQPSDPATIPRSPDRSYVHRAGGDEQRSHTVIGTNDDLALDAALYKLATSPRRPPCPALPSQSSNHDMQIPLTVATTPHAPTDGAALRRNEILAGLYRVPSSQYVAALAGFSHEAGTGVWSTEGHRRNERDAHG